MQHQVHRGHRVTILPEPADEASTTKTVPENDPLTRTEQKQIIDQAIAENKDALKESFGAFGNANAEQMAPANEVPYHPGALKYFAEAGIKVGG